MGSVQSTSLVSTPSTASQAQRRTRQQLLRPVQWVRARINGDVEWQRLEAELAAALNPAEEMDMLADGTWNDWRHAA